MFPLLRCCKCSSLKLLTDLIHPFVGRPTIHANVPRAKHNWRQIQISAPPISVDTPVTLTSIHRSLFLLGRVTSDTCSRSQFTSLPTPTTPLRFIKSDKNRKRAMVGTPLPCLHPQAGKLCTAGFLAETNEPGPSLLASSCYPRLG